MLDCLYAIFAQSVTWVGCDSCVVASVDLEPSWGLFMYCHGLATGRVSSVCHLYITWQGLILHNTSSSLPSSLSAISCLKHSCSSSSQGHTSRCIHAGRHILDHDSGTPLFCCSQSCRVLDLDESLHALKGIFTSVYLLLWLAYYDICVADDCWTCGLMAWDLKVHFSVFFIFGDFGGDSSSVLNSVVICFPIPTKISTKQHSSYPLGHLMENTEVILYIHCVG